MPQLTTTKVDLDLDIIPPSSLVAIEAAQLMAERINDVYIEPARILSEKLNVLYLEPYRQLGKSLGRIVEVHNLALGKMFAAESSLSKIFSGSLFNFPPPTPFKAASLGIFEPVTEGEIVEPRKVETALLPAAIPVPTPRSKMGLRHISGGNFSYKRKTLLGLSLRNREGQLMELMFENPDLFVSDQTINEKFYTQDTFGRSDLIKLLKNKFKLNKLEAIIKRQGEGYILINIRSFYIN